MCLAIPCKVIEIDGASAVVEGLGHTHRVETILLRNKSIDRGDYVLVHEGLAICKLPIEEAQTILKMIETLNAIPGAH